MRHDPGARHGSGALRLLLVDDDEMMRMGVRISLELEAGAAIEIVGETERGEDALPLARALRPDVVLLDIRLIGMDGLGVARLLRRYHPEVGVVAYTTYDDERRLRAMLDAGAHRCLGKPVEAKALAYALRATCREARTGGAGATRCPHAPHDEWRPVGDGADGLSPRERDVLRGVSHVLSSKQIARELGVKPSTVDQYAKSAMAKLAATSRAEAAIAAMRRGLIVA